jgi:hypothetical protein
VIRIPDSHVEHAFDLLKSQKHAAARAAYEFAEKQLKVVLARATLQANGKTVGEREATALASPEYERALTDFRLVAESYYGERDRRDAASAIIDAWRTQQSDMRAMGRVA